ncbi:MAG: hypothetical protein ABI832_23940 [bacterium]
MNTYIAVVFSTDSMAHEGLRALWDLDAEAGLTVHGAAVVRRDDHGHIRVADRGTDLGERTAIGVGIGALLGLLAGPVGVAAGIAGAAALSVGAAAGIGALAGGAVGLTADAVTENRRETAADEAFFKLKHGQSAVVAEISEDWTSILDNRMHALGGVIYRRQNNAATNAAFGASYYNDYLYPYYYEPLYH